MRPVLIGLVLISVGGFFFAACGQDPGTSGTAAGAGGTGGTGGMGGAPNCENVNYVSQDEDASQPCDVCLHDYCCAEVSECRDKGCIDCVNILLSSCGPKPRAVDKCLSTYCKPICSPGAPTASSSSTGGG